MATPFLSDTDKQTIIKALTDESAQLPWPESAAVTPQLIQSLADFIVARLNYAHANPAGN